MVAVLALEGVVGFDLGIPCQVFSCVRLGNSRQPYAVRVCGVRRSVGATAAGRPCFGVEAPYGVDELLHADTVVVPGIAPPFAPPAAEVLATLREAAARGARIASICTGAFVLAAARLLRGRRATTHWAAAQELARRYPDVTVDPDVLFVESGAVLTSAGVAAGLDLCLHLVRTDHGAAVAGATARAIVMPPERAATHPQLVGYREDVDELAPVLAWMEQHLHRPLTVTEIARRAGVSERTLSRRFRDRTGTTPARWLGRQRLLRALHLLEASELSVDQVAVRSGYGSTVALRGHLHRELGMGPRAYRRSQRRAVGLDAPEVAATRLAS